MLRLDIGLLELDAELVLDDRDEIHQAQRIEGGGEQGLLSLEMRGAVEDDLIGQVRPDPGSDPIWFGRRGRHRRPSWVMAASDEGRVRASHSTSASMTTGWRRGSSRNPLRRSAGT